MPHRADALDALEHKSVHILREAYASFRSLCMLWSIGKDSTVLLWLARKAFFGHVPFPLLHIDTGFEIPELLAYRDRLGVEWRLNVIVGRNDEALGAKDTWRAVASRSCGGTATCEPTRRLALAPSDLRG